MIPPPLTAQECEDLVALWRDVPVSRPNSLRMMQPDPQDLAISRTWFAGAAVYASCVVRDTLVAFIKAVGRWADWSMPIDRLIHLTRAAAGVTA